MARAKKQAPASQPLMDYKDVLDTGVCVPAIRAEVASWIASGDYPGVTNTTRTLLHHWFQTDHRLRDRRPFAYHISQRRAVETLVYLYEVANISNQQQMFEKYAQAGQHPRLAAEDPFPRLAVKMATGSGKTKVMSLAIAWQYFNAMLESSNPYASTFLVVAPNVIVFERLQRDFRNGAIFRADPVIPPSLAVHWDFDCYMRGDSERGHSIGALYLTNIQQLYERAPKASSIPDALAGVLGPDPKTAAGGGDEFVARLTKRGEPVLVVNDEAHHTHATDSEWMNAIGRVNRFVGVGMQLDFTATPRFTNGVIFPWTAYDYPLRSAIDDGIVKRPMKGLAHFDEAPSDHAPTRYAGYLAAGVERWKEYRDQLAPSGKRPLLFLMLNKSSEADEVSAWLKAKYPEDFAGEKTVTIHTDNTGEVSQKDLEQARKLVDEVDLDTSPANAIVSVLMLREGWDVQNVTVVVGLRPFSAKSNILPEQAIGRGLRLMFRGRSGNAYTERVDIIGNKAFLDFVDDLEKLEGIKMDTFDIGKDRLRILTIEPVPGRELHDIGIPELSRVIIRRQDLGEVIAALDLDTIKFATLVPSAPAVGEKMLFEGVVGSESPLQVAVARLLGYKWPDQPSDGDPGIEPIGHLVDEDGIVCLPSVNGEATAAERLRAFLVEAHRKPPTGERPRGAPAWPTLPESPNAWIEQLLAEAGSPGKSLEEWLREDFFAQHIKLFHNRPFTWHVWDGEKDGFSALANYHKLDHAGLQKLIFVYLNWWLEVQQRAANAGEVGADRRLLAATKLKQKLELILEGEEPYDIYVRWKPTEEQSIGWNPDLDDGVRMNIRPFMTADILRRRPNIKWDKDRGKNPDGSDRINDLHFKISFKREARRNVGGGA